MFSRGFFGWFWFGFFLAFEVGLCRWVMLLGGGGGVVGVTFGGFCVVFVHSGECWLYSRDGSCSVSATHCSWCVHLDIFLASLTLLRFQEIFGDLLVIDLFGLPMTGIC